MYISESRLVGEERQDGELIGPGSQTICHAMATISRGNRNSDKLEMKVKLDSCGSVSIAHSHLLTEVKATKHYKLRNIRLMGIGGTTHYLTQAGILRIEKGRGRYCKILCYVFNRPLGDTEQVILLGLQTVMQAGINVLAHMQDSVNGKCTALKFWPKGMNFEQALQDITVDDNIKRIFKQRKSVHPRDIYMGTHEYDEVTGQDMINLAINHIEVGNTVVEEAYMTEIQLRRIVERTAKDEVNQLSDGDETMIKDGERISKFSKQAMGLGKDVYDEEGCAPLILRKIYLIYDKYVGQESVFPLKNGAPRIMTKYKDKPYTYELQPEYAAGERKFPCVKAMDWTGKTATAQVIRGFIQGTPVVERCGLPLCISRLVIAPKFAPGQVKDDPDHGFRVCVNALINKCLKPYASTIPLATDEIKKLEGYKYYLQADGFSAYWSIPVCEESKRLTAFHTPDGIYCWTRLMMGATPSSAVQQTAYLEALDEFIDYDEHGNLRKCLVDEEGNRLRDSEGNLKTLRHRFAVYCDDIAAGANTLEELYELFEALICACHKAGIQIKAAKVKFGVRKVTFHNYTISSEGVEPKEANLCGIRNMNEPRDIHQVRAFLGCCQQLKSYIKDYGIIAKPLHDITKKGAKGPPPWIKGTDYDIAFLRLKVLILDGKLYLHHKDKLKRLFIEVDASDVGWGACAYQMKEPWTGDPAEEGRMRIGDTGERLVIQWISKGWTTHELQLPVFYREALGRLLALEKFRNLIETNIEAGITLYTDHKPALFENSLSNKGQLSAWKLAEVSDLLSIVENLYRQGGKMLFADPLSRVCGPTEGWHDPSLPGKIATLLRYLPTGVREMQKIRLYAGKDTGGVSKILYQWRKQKGLLASSITSGKLPTTTEAMDAFHVGVEDVNKIVGLCRSLISNGKQFAVLIPVSIAGEIARLENDNGDRRYDGEMLRSVEGLSRIILAQDAEMWLLHITGHRINEFVSTNQQGLSETQSIEMVQCSLDKFRRSKANQMILEQGVTEVVEADHQEQPVMLPITRSKMGARNSPGSSIDTPAANSIVEAPQGETSNNGRIISVIREGRIKWERCPREPLPQLDDVSEWVGKQLDHLNLPKKYQCVPPEGVLIPLAEDYPEGLFAIPNKDGQPRIIVPSSMIKPLILQTHEDIHHQNHIKVLHVLRAAYYWPNMAKDVQEWCTSCATCTTASVRRKHLKTKFDLMAPQSRLLPRQHYGIDFYGIHKGEILVIVDLFTRETILTFLRNRTQENVARALSTNVIFQRGVPMSLRTDNAPELSSLTGAVTAIAQYLNITQIKTGGHNPRGNSICERVNQSLGAMIRKLSDADYANIDKIALPAFQFALNTTFNSAIGCTPFEAGHGLSATTIAQARTQVTRRVIDAEGGRDGDTLEDVDEFFDKSDIKQQFELAMRMAEVTRSTSEWHRRMTAENLGQHGQVVNLSDLPIGAKAYVYKPPTQQETIARGRKAKHIDHYIGPGTITSHLGTRSVVVTIKDKNGIEREYQRDAGMILLRKPRPDDQDPVDYRERSQGTRMSSARDIAENPLKEGEFVILKDDPEAKDWYCAEIRAVLPDRIEVNYYTTQAPSLANYETASRNDRESRIEIATFLRTWCLKGDPTTEPPKSARARDKQLWWGRIPLEDIDKHILIRDVGLSASGKLDRITINLATKLKIPHHQGAGGEDDFTDKEAFQKQLKRKEREKNKRNRK